MRWIIGLFTALLASIGCAIAQPSVQRALFPDLVAGKAADHDRFVRFSVYVPVRDGTRIAVDIVRPARNGQAITGPLPTILEVTGYGRAWIDPGTGVLRDCIACEMHFWRHGYATAAMDARGTGASFGLSTDGPYTREGGRDAADVIAWIARQPWSNGNVGLSGLSYAGRIQYHVAAEAPPALKAIMPGMAAFDVFDGHTVKGGAVSRAALAWQGSGATETDAADAPLPAPVDGPDGPALRDAARAANAAAAAAGSLFLDQLGQALPEGMGRDEVPWGEKLPETGFVNHHLLAPLVRKSGIPALIWNGWEDAFAIDALRWHAALPGSRMIMGNWAHLPYLPGASDDPRDRERLRIYESESLRWFDRWLRGKPTGVERDPPMRYAVTDARGGWSWHAGNAQEILTHERSSLLLSGDALIRSDPEQGRRVLTVDRAASTGRGRLWEAIGEGSASSDFGAPSLYPDLAANDARGLAFTSAPLNLETRLIGMPVAILRVDADAPDALVTITLTEVLPDGRSRYLSEGMSLLAWRGLADPPYDNFGLPWQSIRAAERAPVVPGKPVTLTLVMEPVARVLARGSRLRLSVHGADADNVAFESLPAIIAAHIGINTGGDDPSRIELPVR